MVKLQLISSICVWDSLLKKKFENNSFNPFKISPQAEKNP